MNHYVLLGIICSLLLISLTGVCLAEELPVDVAYIQGGECSIAEGTDEMYVITVQDFIPYFHVPDGMKSLLIPVERLTNRTYPVNAALLFSGSDGESASLVEVSNLSIASGDKVLTLGVKPLEFYEGKALKPLSTDFSEVGENTGKTYAQFGMYLELPIRQQSNDDHCHCFCPYMVDWCDCNTPCEDYCSCWCGYDSHMNYYCMPKGCDGSGA